MTGAEIYDWLGEYARLNVITARNYALTERSTRCKRCRAKAPNRHIDPTRLIRVVRSKTGSEPENRRVRCIKPVEARSLGAALCGCLVWVRRENSS
jgi:hypothetical protein